MVLEEIKKEIHLKADTRHMKFDPAWLKFGQIMSI